MATTYAGITNKPVRVFNIRGKRRNPGLRPQHLATLKAAARLCTGALTGAEIGSTEIEFRPRTLRGGKHSIDIGTAGSISLMLQCLTPLLMFSPKPSNLSIRGGTAVNWSPPMPFIQNIVYSAISEMGADLEISIGRHGFYPKGGGEVAVESRPVTSLIPFRPEPPIINRIKVVSICGNLPSHVSERQAKSAERILAQQGFSSDIAVKTVKSSSPGSVIVLWTEGSDVFMGSDSLGERGKPAEKVGSEAAGSLIAQIQTGANVDKHTGDHLVLPCSLADGVSMFRVSELTMHTLTAIEMAKTFTECTVDVDGKIGKPARIEIRGIGHVA
jgi:RNA 3'-terminal phosphate cyclase (ATP)